MKRLTRSEFLGLGAARPGGAAAASTPLAAWAQTPAPVTPSAVVTTDLVGRTALGAGADQTPLG